MNAEKLKVIDLFAGAGGLSLGFEQTAKFEVKAAVEINKFARNTYATNKDGVEIFPDITTLNYDEVLEKYGKIDVVIGGPPCQGFSNANRQKNNLISGNNSLVRHFIKAIEKLTPDAFVMENVKTMNSETHKFFMVQGEKEELERLKVTLNEDETILLGDVNQLAFGLDELEKFKEDVSQFMIDKTLFSKLNFLYRVRMNKDKMNSYLHKEQKLFGSLSEDCRKHHHTEPISESYNELWTSMIKKLNKSLEQHKVEPMLLDDICIILEVQKVLSKIAEVQQHNLVHELYIHDASLFVKLTSYNVFEFVNCKFTDLGYSPQADVLKAVEFGVPQQRERLFVVGIKENSVVNKLIEFLPKGFLTSKEYYTVSDAFEDIESIDPMIEVTGTGIPKGNAFLMKDERNSLYNYLNDSNLLFNHIITDTRATALQRYKVLKPGESFKDLDDDFKTTYSDPTRTQKTIYHRLHYGIPSRTVVNVRKSMWVHPRKNRAVSVREAARLQSFPDSYIFRGTKDAQYQQVGNAVPPLLGRAVAEQLLRVMGHEIKNPLSEELSRPLFCNV